MILSKALHLARSMRYILFALGAGTIAVAGAFTLPLHGSERPVVRVQQDVATLTLASGSRIFTTFPSPGGVLTGIRIFSPAEAFGGRKLRAQLLDAGGEVRGRTATVRASYSGDILALTLPWWSRVRTNAGDTLTLQLSLERGEPLPLLVSVSDLSKNVSLVGAALPGAAFGGTPGSELNRELFFSVLQATTLPQGAQRGVVVAALFLVGASILVSLPERLRRYRWLVAASLLAIVTPLALGGIWFSLGAWGISDWDYYFSLHEVYRRSILVHHAFPFWNPYTCGGTAGLADPEFPILGVLFPLELLFGVPTGLRLSLFVSVAVGALGMLALGRRLGVSPTAAVVAALGAAFGSVHLLELAEGHVNIFAAMWIPWIFWFWLLAYRGRIRPAWCGVFLALTFFQGGIYLLSYTALAFLVLPWLVSRPRRALTVTARASVVALGFAAVKLVPVLFWVRQFPDASYANSIFTLPYLPEIFLGRYLHGTVILPGQGSGWHEYGAYVGPVLLVLAFLGALQWKARRAARGLVIAAVLAIILSTAGPFLKPFFDTVLFIPRSNISRVIAFGVIALSLLAALGMERVITRFRHGAGVALFLLGALAVDLFPLAFQLSEQAFILPPVTPPVAPAPSPLAFTAETYAAEVANEQHSRTYAATLAGYGTMSACSVLSPHPSVRTIHDDGDTSYATLVPPAGTVEVLAWSANRARVRYSASQDVTVAINTNFARGWVANAAAAKNVEGRVGAAVPAGDGEVLFVYRAPGFPAGLSLTLLTVVVLVGQTLLSRRRRAV